MMQEAREMEDHQQRKDEHIEPAHEVLEELATDISRRWLGGYVGLETLPGQGSSAPPY